MPFFDNERSNSKANKKRRGKKLIIVAPKPFQKEAKKHDQFR